MIIKKMINRFRSWLFADLKEEMRLIREESNEISKKLNHSIVAIENSQNQVIELHNDFSRYHTAWQRNAINIEHNDLYNLRNLYELFPMHSISLPLKRIGREEDGGYIMVDDFKKSRIAYSFGICDDVSWDKAILEEGIAKVYMYDHTINSLPEYNDAFIWKKIGIIGKYDEDKPNLKTLEQIILDNGHVNEKYMILKIDVEGAEWDVFSNISTETLNKFSQITVEMHWLLNKSLRETIVKALEKINITHVPVHIHGNNNSGYDVGNGYILPDVIEATYVNKEEYASCLKRANIDYPKEFDKINRILRSEIILGSWG